MIKKLRSIGVLILVLVILRGWIYRSTINYSSIGKRKEVRITNQVLLNKINHKTTNNSLNIETIIDIAYAMTTEELSFTSRKVNSNPNELINTKKANCVGYSAMFNSIANYLIRKNNFESRYEAIHQIGKLQLLGTDVHQFFNSPFLNDHDFNNITNIKTGETVSLDPSMGDYLYIKKVISISEKNTL